MSDHHFRIRVYYEDTDFSGVVYHARYLHFFERARTEALRACGVSHTDLLARAEPLVFAVRTMTTHWLAPARLAEADVVAACLSLDGRPRRLPPDLAAKLAPADGAPRFGH